MVIGIYTSRVVLQTLGVDDYGFAKRIGRLVESRSLGIVRFRRSLEALDGRPSRAVH